MSDRLPSPEGNRGAIPTWGSLLQLQTTDRSWTKTDVDDKERPVEGKGELYRDRSIGRILRFLSQKCQRTITPESAKSTEKAGTCHRLSSLGDAGLQLARRNADMRTGMKRTDLRVYCWVALTAVLVCFAAPASAQYKPRTLDDPATGEKYRIEGGADFWFPTADMVVESEQLGIPGSQINLKRDLGLVDTRFRALQVQLRPARSHKLRFEYLPVTYTQSAILNQDIVFNG